MNLHEERMSDGMLKIHIEGLMGSAVFHDFTQPDYGDFHDHPWPFRSIVLLGGYIEEVLHLDGTLTQNHRAPGDSFRIEAGHTHRIIDLPAGRCQTIIIPYEAERKSGFYQMRDDGIYHRFHDQPDFSKLA